MADQRRWFKVWTSLLVDFDFIPDEIVGKWTRLGARTALVGENGTVEFVSWEHLFSFLKMSQEQFEKARFLFRNIAFEEGKNRHGAITVTWQNWVKYQVDSTQAERARASRSKRRGEEKRREKKRKEESEVVCSDHTAEPVAALDPTLQAILSECPHLALVSSAVSSGFWDQVLGACESYPTADGPWLGAKLRAWNQWFEGHLSRRSRDRKRLESRLMGWLSRDLEQIARRRG